MTITLTRGENTSLLTSDPTLHHVRVGLGWDLPQADGQPFDLDASAFLVQANGRVRGDADFVFYNNPGDASGSVRHSGDSLEGEGGGDDERITVDLQQLPGDISKVVIGATIHDADQRGHHFGLIRHAYIRLVNLDTGQELARFDLGDGFSEATAMIFGEIYRHNSDWKFRALGMGFQGGLAAMASSYGLEVTGA